jgi:hypothetical protein
MPRIRDEYLKCVAYLYRSEHEAKEAINIGGSAFLVSVLLEGFPPPMGAVYAVTNKHVIQKNAKCLRINTSDGGTEVFKLSNWHLSKEDDLAVCLVPYLDPFRYAVGTIPQNNFLTEDIVYSWGVGPGDEVVLIGRFINQEGKQRNIPTVRFGHIAQMPMEPLEYDGQFQESFLCEIKSIGGFSGSPVFFAPEILPKLPDGKEPEEKSFLLGVDWCHVQNVENALDEKGREIDHIQVRVNSGMMGVIPAWKLQKLLNSDEVVEMRRAIADGERKYRSQPDVSLDSAVAIDAVLDAASPRAKRREPGGL